MTTCGTNAGYAKHIRDNTQKCNQCKEAHSIYIKKYYLEKSKEIRKKRIERYYSQPEVEREKRKEYYLKNSDKEKSYSKFIRKNKPEKKRESERRRRTLKKNGNVQKYKESEVLDLYGWVCHICNGFINPAASRSAGIGDWELGLHIDHLIPISKGGEDSLSNVRPSHAVCNLKKHAKPLSK